MRYEIFNIYTNEDEAKFLSKFGLMKLYVLIVEEWNNTDSDNRFHKQKKKSEFVFWRKKFSRNKYGWSCTFEKKKIKCHKKVNDDWRWTMDGRRLMRTAYPDDCLHVPVVYSY